MAYKFQLGDAILSGALKQEGDIDIISAGKLKVGSTVVIDAARNLSASTLDGQLQNPATSLELADTDDVSEGSSNQYFTNARARAALSMEADRFIAYNGSTGAFTMDETLLTSSVRGMVSVTDAGGDGSMAYNASTGVLTFTGPSASEVRAHMTAGEMLEVSSGVYKIKESEFSGSALDVIAHADAAAGIRAKISVTDAGGDGSLAYNASSGVITYTGPSAAEVRAHMTGGEMITFSGGEIKITAAEYSASFADALATKNTANLTEGTNLYFTDARARAAISEAADVLSYNNSTGVLSVVADAMSGSIADTIGAHAGAISAVRSKVSVTDAGGDGSLAYNSSTGVITYTGPSAAEVRAHVSVTDAGGDGSLAYNAGTGVITYTGPSASEVRAHLSVAPEAMIDYSSGVFSIDESEFSGSVLDTIAHADAAAGVRAHLSVTDTNSMDLSYSGGAFSADLKLNSGDGDASMEVVSGGLRLKSTVAGAGLTLASGVLSLDGAVVSSHGDANANLAEGFNYGSADLTANRTWTLPATPAAGDVVHVKAPLVGSNKLIIAAGAGDSIDGVASIEIESDSGAVSLMAISDAAWRIF